MTSFFTHGNLPLRGRTYFSPRPQGTNSVTTLVGVTPYIYDPYRCSNWSMWTLNLAYVTAFTTHTIAQYFFGYNTLRFSGSMVAERPNNDILADYFGLSQTFESTVLIEPRLQNVVAQFQGYFGLDGLAKGLYFNIYAPLTWVRSELKLKETVNATGILTPYPANYMSNVAIPAPLMSVEEAFKRTVPFGDVQEPLRFGTIAGPKTLVRIADVHMIFGWNFLLQDNGHVGLNIHAVAPTGNRSRAVYLFEPIAGNGHHWELGLGASGHVRIWEKDGDQDLCLYVDATITHLFSSLQRRSFDLCKNGFGSRYILIKQFDGSGAYIRSSLPAINRTTLFCNVSRPVQVDFTIMFGYKHCDVSFDFGYNGWIVSREKLCLREGIQPNTYGFKGIQNVTLMSGAASQATESTARLHGTNFAFQALLTDNPSPVFISTADINVHSGAAHMAFTHKLFAHLNYAWQDICWNAEPFFGGGGDVEFVGEKPRNDTPNKPFMGQWSIWIKAGLVY